MAGRVQNLKPFKKGESGNPGGRPKKDLASIIAHEVFAEQPEKIKAAFAKALQRGDAAVFKALADRAFGRLPQPVEHSGSDGRPINIIFGCEMPPWMKDYNQPVEQRGNAQGAELDTREAQTLSRLPREAMLGTVPALAAARDTEPGE